MVRDYQDWKTEMTRASHQTTSQMKHLQNKLRINATNQSETTLWCTKEDMDQGGQIKDNHKTSDLAFNEEIDGAHDMVPVMC